MASFLSRVAATAARTARPATASARRNMSSGSPQEVYESKELWFKTTFAAAAAVIVPFTAYTIVKEAQHEHHHGTVYSHMHQRHKPFPWPEDCALFDLHCKHEARHAKHAAAAH